jgi:hypothetical protein
MDGLKFGNASDSRIRQISIANTTSMMRITGQNILIKKYNKPPLLNHPFVMIDNISTEHFLLSWLQAFDYLHHQRKICAS